MRRLALSLQEKSFRYLSAAALNASQSAIKIPRAYYQNKSKRRREINCNWKTKPKRIEAQTRYFNLSWCDAPKNWEIQEAKFLRFSSSTTFFIFRSASSSYKHRAVVFSLIFPTSFEEISRIALGFHSLFLAALYTGWKMCKHGTASTTTSSV